MDDVRMWIFGMLIAPLVPALIFVVVRNTARWLGLGQRREETSYPVPSVPVPYGARIDRSLPGGPRT
jgi:hypothetical protein